MKVNHTTQEYFTCLLHHVFIWVLSYINSLFLHFNLLKQLLAETSAAPSDNEE